MDYRQLSYFLAVCDACSITGAASVINISEQALSKAIRDLEGELGAKLFVRSNRGVEVTAQGEELMREARSYLSHHDAIKGMFTSAADQRERVSLGAPSGVMSAWLPDGFFARLHCDPSRGPVRAALLCRGPLRPAAPCQRARHPVLHDAAVSGRVEGDL